MNGSHSTNLNQGYVRKIVCAANKHTVFNDVFLVGIRHWESQMRKQFERLCKLYPANMHPTDFVQGFFDNDGNFLTRKEAYKVARKAGQIKRKAGGYDGVELYSEDLY